MNLKPKNSWASLSLLEFDAVGAEVKVKVLYVLHITMRKSNNLFQRLTDAHFSSCANKTFGDNGKVYSVKLNMNLQLDSM